MTHNDPINDAKGRAMLLIKTTLEANGYIVDDSTPRWLCERNPSTHEGDHDDTYLYATTPHVSDEGFPFELVVSVGEAQ